MKNLKSAPERHPMDQPQDFFCQKERSRPSREAKIQAERDHDYDGKPDGD